MNHIPPRNILLIIWLSLLYIAVLFSISWWYWVFSLTISLGFYTLVAFCISCLWKYLRNAPLPSWKNFAIYFLLRVYIVIWGVIVSLCIFFYYHNHISPAYIESYSLSNGEKTIFFQAMSHIASPEFYTKVQENIQEKKSQGYVLFYEGVSGGSEESITIFRQALWIDLDSESYEKLSELYGMVAQNNQDFLGFGSTEDINVDLDLDSVVRLYREKVGQENIQRSMQKDIVNIESDILQVLDGLRPREKKILQYINQGFMNIFIKNPWLQDMILWQFWPDIFSVILDERNAYVVEEVRKSEYEKIIILYGMLHFEGIFQLLQQQDSRWKVVNIQKQRLIY